MKAIRILYLPWAPALLFMRVRFFPQTTVGRMRIIAQGAILLGIISWAVLYPAGLARASRAAGCENLGWFPEGFGVKDHHLFRHAGYYYLVSIYVPPGETSPFLQDRFAYARSTDLCTWEELAPILSSRVPGTGDVQAIWAPFVLQENDQYYLYYTAVSPAGTQSIRLAATTDPSNPLNWQPQEMIFEPDHPGTQWKAGEWADARDPMVVKIGESFHLYYSSSDISGGIVGRATAPSPTGPWTDYGAILEPLPGDIPESPVLVRYGERYYLFYNLSYRGGFYRIGDSPVGPWGEPVPFRPGWAHEVWTDAEGLWRASFLTDYSVTISSLVWDATFNPARPVIGSSVHHQFLPILDKPTHTTLLR